MAIRRPDSLEATPRQIERISRRLEILPPRSNRNAILPLLGERAGVRIPRKAMSRIAPINWRTVLPLPWGEGGVRGKQAFDNTNGPQLSFMGRGAEAVR